MRRRIYADWDGDRPDDDRRDDRDDHRRRQTLHDDVSDRFVVVAAAIRPERPSQIAIDDEVAHPAEVLRVQRLAQAIALCQALNLGVVNDQALIFQVDHITAQVIAGGGSWMMMKEIIDSRTSMGIRMKIRRIIIPSIYFSRAMGSQYDSETNHRTAAKFDLCRFIQDNITYDSQRHLCGSAAIS